MKRKLDLDENIIKKRKTENEQWYLTITVYTEDSENPCFLTINGKEIEMDLIEPEMYELQDTQFNVNDKIEIDCQSGIVNIDYIFLFKNSK